MTTRATQLVVDFCCEVLRWVAPSKKGERFSGIGVDFNQTGSCRLIGRRFSKAQKEEGKTHFLEGGIL